MNSTRTIAEVGSRGSYFFLSYAHTPPILEPGESSADLWVTTFYQHLRTQVGRCARPGTELEAGFMEEQLPLNDDWKTKVAWALGAAEVFVPLYSPSYFRRSWPQSEEASFRRRLDVIGPERSQGHVQPVLWVPLARGDQVAKLDEAMRLGSDVPEYAENGLFAMCRLTIFRDQYKIILERLARQIVEVAEEAPLGRSSAPMHIDVTEPAGGQTSFLIAVIAPTVDELPDDRARAPYGVQGKAWRPFDSASVLPVAEYAANVAQRLGLDTETIDLVGNAAAFTANPGIVLIDPWILTVAGGRAALQSAIETLPEWVVLLVLIDENDAQFAARGEKLLTNTLDTLGANEFRIVKYARDVSAFVQLTPSIVTQARRRFLSKAPMPTRNAPPPTRRRLSGWQDPTPTHQEEDR